jgi:hypothetical protein
MGVSTVMGLAQNRGFIMEDPSFLGYPSILGYPFIIDPK